VTGFHVPRKLEKSDSRDDFASGAAELDEWFARFAWENQAAVARAEAPQRLAERGPAQIPCILLARLAVDNDFAGRGAGAGLLRDALRRSYQLSGSIGAAAVLIHCRDESAKNFYLRHGDFLPSPVDDLHLMVPTKALRPFIE
jgi:GNAT superfamily N-acetyltransferase